MSGSGHSLRLEPFLAINHSNIDRFLVAETTLANANKWRTQRGEPEITMAELNKEN